MYELKVVYTDDGSMCVGFKKTQNTTPEQITNCLSESCVGCKNLHLSTGQYRCFKYEHVVPDGQFICWPKIGTQYPKPIYDRWCCFKTA